VSAANKNGRVTKLADIKGILEYRFVGSFDWTPPKPFCDHIAWFVFDPVKHADEYERVKKDMVARAERLKTWCNIDWDGTGSWYSVAKAPYVAKVTYEETERPILVLIGGFTITGTTS
jgi:hypothetical protein